LGQGQARRVRQPVDPVGFTHSASGIARVVAHAQEAERRPAAGASAAADADPGAELAGAISPHDDYVYAQRVYVHVYPHLKARDVLLIGVAHKARDFPEVEGRLVFDSCEAWHGPHGEVAISPLREALLRRLPRDDLVVHDRLQAVEHSVEAMVPFLQHFNREARIVSILVPFMSWERLRDLSARLSAALSEVMGARAWMLGRDLGLVRDHLVGEISLSTLERFYRQLVQDDPHEYRISW
jgi:AmmeMemoRadiSam system protein B